MNHVYYSSDKYGIGYKCFYHPQFETLLTTEYCGPDVKAKLNKWYKVTFPRKQAIRTISADGMDEEDKLRRYPAGFHIWAELRHARSYIGDKEFVYKVKFRDLVSVGTNQSYNNDSEFGLCFIARELMLLEKMS